METTENPPSRKRAAIACDMCRKRKRRCNGSRPRCQLCRGLNVDCHYQELLSSNLDSRSASSLVQRLERLENYFQQPTSLTPPSLQQADVDNVDVISVTTPLDQAQVSQAPLSVDLAGSPAYSFSGIAPSQYMQTTISNENDQGGDTMSIPFGHSTTTGSLLHMPQTSAILGQYPLDLFFRIEQRRPVPQELSLNISSLPHLDNSTFDRSITDSLVEQYFSLVNSQHPVLDATEFWSIYAQVPSNSVHRALCLIVLALAEAALQQQQTTKTLAWMPGVLYFKPALSIILQQSLVSFGTDIALPQSLYLAALYYSYLARPLLAWKLVHMASTNVQHLWIQYQDKHEQSENGHAYQSTIRLMWAIFVLECDIIAEYHLPRSGIEHVVDHLPFPRCGDPPQQNMIFWLADLSARRLLNRVHHAMYHQPLKRMSDVARGVAAVPEPVHRAVGSYVHVSEELRRQLATWYKYLPQSMQPNLEDTNLTVDEAILVLRYHAAGDIISRPFIFHVCSLPDGLEPPDFVLDNCKLCIRHCRKYLEVFGKRVELPSGSTEITLHSALACMIILTLASRSSLLHHLVSDLDELLDKSVRQIERWAFPGSSIETIHLIAKVLVMKHNAAKPL